MCQFKSAIVALTSEGQFDLLHNPWMDSHEDLVRLFKLNDKPNVRGDCRFARIEFRPESPEDYDKPDKYQLIIDEARTPEWFTDEMKARVFERMKLIIASMIISGDADISSG